MNLSQAYIKKSLKRVDSYCVSFGGLDSFACYGAHNHKNLRQLKSFLSV